ncbi:MAG TPA: enoyl-CoA hydratase/isomerase family protein [Gemmatimonadales bacterium]|nr:enoyl-CoA hydratase/isomerase family protein [Gemmatimonadales bacterium]
MTAVLLTRLDAGVLTLTLNRPDKRNALNTELIDQLHRSLESADLNADVRVVVLRGAGKDFCAGADLDELLASADRSEAENEASALRLGSLFEKLRTLPKPVMAMVHGRALAGGAGLASACDLILAAADAQLGYPEIQRGFAPAMVMALLRRMVGEKVALDLVLTGRVLRADEAERVGLISRVVPAAELEPTTHALAAELSRASGTALAFTKRLFYELDGQTLRDGIAQGARVNAVARSTPDFRDAVARFLRK